MILKKLLIENYRNIKTIEIIPDERINVIYGENAQGKTNIIESIFIFSGSHSFRGNKDSELVMIGKKENEKTELTCHFSTTYDEYCGKIIISNKRFCWLNDVNLKSPNEMSDNFPVVVFSPKDLDLVKDGPEERRKFLDNGLFQLKASYGELLKTYRHALDQRNAVLKNIKFGSENEKNLDIWDNTLSIIGSKIIFQREKYVQNLSIYSQNFFCGLSNKKETLELSVDKTVETNSENIKEIEEKMFQRLQETRQKDVAWGYTSVGPHRDDLNIIINDLSAKSYGSQGQQRSASLAIKMGEAYIINEVFQETPIVLLDDVLSELDEKRQSYILNNIDMFQVFITCCDAESVLRLKKGRKFHISKGKII